jgi:hypothetical protein
MGCNGLGICWSWSGLRILHLLGMSWAEHGVGIGRAGHGLVIGWAWAALLMVLTPYTLVWAWVGLGVDWSGLDTDWAIDGLGWARARLR